MAAQNAQLDWPTCSVEDCRGTQVDAEGQCLAHTTKDERESIFARLAAGAAVEVAAGVQFTEDLLADLLAAVPSNNDGAPLLNQADFRSAVLPAIDLQAATLVNARFDRASFQGDAGFGGASFQGDARFEVASFQGDAGFGGASFQGDAWFDRASFQGDAGFGGASFQGDTWFDRASFQGDAGFEVVSFQGRAGFDRASFQGRAWFDRAGFQGDASFVATSFQDTAAFSAASFQGAARFDGASFQAAIRFDGANITGDAVFDRASFQGDAGFDGASITGDAGFDGVSFHGDAGFDRVSFQGRAGFDRVSFHGDAGFGGVSFHGDAGFDRVSFQGRAGFDGASFHGDAGFGGASFHGDAGFDQASFHGDARFDRASFQQPIDLGPLAVAGTLGLNGIESDQSVQLEVAARRLSCKGIRFRGGGHLRVAWAEVSLDDAEIPSPLIIAMHSPRQELTERAGWLADPNRRAREFPAPRPSLVSVQRADVAGLVLSDIDLRECHFAGAHHIDQLQLTTADAFHRAPALSTRPSRSSGRRRQVLAEECRWRQTRPGWRGRRWRHTTSELFCSSLLAQARRPEPAELAAIYRRLRKGREDAKNEPGAADFYFGEMEMRRHTPNTSRAERLLLGLYWLTAGYGLRAGRALTTLGVVLAILAIGFWQVGFGQHHPTYGASLVYAALATLSLEGKAKALADQLTIPGELLRISLRLTGPVLLALALLSIRNRVKR